MRIPWIRVHGGLYDKPVADRLARATRINEHEAIGVLVTFWSGVAANALNGFIADASDAQLEKWAKWHRKRGAFAAWVRADHQDAEGRVPEWDDYAGALELRRDKERQRLADKRKVLRNGVADVAQHPTNNRKLLQPARAVRDGTVRDDTEQLKDQKRTGRVNAPVPPWVGELAAVWTAQVGHLAPAKIRKALTALVDQYGADVVKAALEIYVSPDEGPPPDKPKKPEWFAENFHRWRTIAETPIDDGRGALTDRGRRLAGGTL